MAKIKSLLAREVLDASGWPTLELKLMLDNKVSASASVSGNYGAHPPVAQELRDQDHRRYHGRGVLRAVSNINEIIAPRLLGFKIDQQREIDQALNNLDGTPDKHFLGANTILAVSMVCARAAAAAAKEELYVYLAAHAQLTGPSLPVPIFNIFSGGDSNDTQLDFQEYLLLPNANSSAFSEIKERAANYVRGASEIFQAVGDLLAEAGYGRDLGMKGGYAPDMDSSLEALEMIKAAMLRCSYRPGEDFNLGLNIGSAFMHDEEAGAYIFSLGQHHISSVHTVDLYREWLEKYPIAYLVDGFQAGDYDSWHKLSSALGERLVLAGDDSLSSQASSLRKAIEHKAGNAIVIRPIMIGTLTETIEVVRLAKRQGYRVIIATGASETDDSLIVDLAVAVGADYLQAGPPCRGEYVAKYNRLLEIGPDLAR